MLKALFHEFGINPRKFRRPEVSDNETRILQIINHNEEDGGAIKVKMAARFVMTSVEGVRAHKLIQQPFRNWCRQCVMGRFDDIKHMPFENQRAYLVTSIDDTYLTKQIEKTNCVS